MRSLKHKGQVSEKHARDHYSFLKGALDEQLGGRVTCPHWIRFPQPYLRWGMGMEALDSSLCWILSRIVFTYIFFFAILCPRSSGIILPSSWTYICSSERRTACDSHAGRSHKPGLQPPTPDAPYQAHCSPTCLPLTCDTSLDWFFHPTQNSQHWGSPILFAFCRIHLCLFEQNNRKIFTSVF